MTMKKNYNTQILPSDERAIALAVISIKEGEPVALPTETVYGLAADATNELAIKKIYSAKKRPEHNPLIVHVGKDCHSLEALVEKGYVDLSSFTQEACHTLRSLISTYWPGPLTLVLPRGQTISKSVAKGLTTVGFRMPDNSVFLKVIEKSGLPLAAPSANQANCVSPTTAKHVYEELQGRIPLILEGEPSKVGVESTIFSLEAKGQLSLLRPGGIPVEEIEDFLDVTIEKEIKTSDPIKAPGMMSLHYSPRKPLFIQTELKDLKNYKIIDVLVIGEKTQDNTLEDFSFNYLPNNDKLVARELFAVLRRLDSSNSEAIIVLMKHEHKNGLWPAINDRLQRAAKKS